MIFQPVMLVFWGGGVGGGYFLEVKFSCGDKKDQAAVVFSFLGLFQTFCMLTPTTVDG